MNNAVLVHAEIYDNFYDDDIIATTSSPGKTPTTKKPSTNQPSTYTPTTSAPVSVADSLTSTPAVVGLGVGIPVGFLLLSATAVFILRSFAKKNNTNSKDINGNSVSAASSNDVIKLSVAHPINTISP